ncbi:MAG TPA: hypothetical protein VMI94_29070 [Bryobacteraceae bacterium]|nr:hypothetical protein [Bryobacteraceae bacterium]
MNASLQNSQHPCRSPPEPSGLNFVEVVDPTEVPSYTINSTCLRFPSTALSTVLLSEVQQIVPLIHIRMRESAVPDIYVSDRRVTVDGQLYLPRLIGIGEPGSDVLVSQDIKGTSDNVQFTFGNGDRVMTQLPNDTDLKYAEIDLCLFHVNSGILLQLWKGLHPELHERRDGNLPGDVLRRVLPDHEPVPGAPPRVSSARKRRSRDHN